MISSLTFDADRKEQEKLSVLLKELAARLTDEYWSMEQAESLEQVGAYFSDKPLLDLLLYDVTQDEAIAYLLKLRQEYRTTQLLILADVTTSPMKYLKPGILASSLLLRPWNKQQAYKILKEFIQSSMKSRTKKADERLFVIETKDGNWSIPYGQIYFFEAREKKIYVCSGKEEIGFYSTIDKLSEELPEQFIRCHRGFIVNSAKIRKIVLSQNLIYLVDGFDVPLSRSYKAAIKDFGK